METNYTPFDVPVRMLAMPPCCGGRGATPTGAYQEPEPEPDWLREIRSRPVLVSGWPVRVPKLVQAI